MEQLLEMMLKEPTVQKELVNSLTMVVVLMVLPEKKAKMEIIVQNSDVMLLNSDVVLIN